MISNIKKHFPSQILQLILALSLLQSDLDPDNYFEWDLESRYSRGNVGLLERHAPPLSEYPYANRKAMMPLIEDLARFDSVPSAFQTYLFTHNATFPVPETPPPSNSSQQNQTTTTIEPDQPSEEIFLNSEIFTESTSILDQNLADLNDFGEAAAHYLNIYDNLKEEHVENTLFDLFKCERPGSSCDDPEFGSFTAPSPDDDEGGAGGVVEWDEYFGVKHEIDESLLAIKEESDSLNEIEVHTTLDPEEEITLEPVTAELTQEEMDLIKILATQDIDMGFVPPETDAERVKKERDDKDTAEKLKILLDISDDKAKKSTDEDDEDDFGGLPFTIDLETGEKILLSSATAADTFDEPVFEDVSAFDQLESVQLTELIDEASGTSSPSTRATTSSFNEDLSEFGIDPSDFDALLLDPVETSDRSTTDDSEAVLDFDDTELDMYIQSSSFPNAHSRQQNYGHGVNGLRQSSYLPHHPQSRVPLGRSLSMEQRFDFPMFSFTPGMGMGMDMAPNHPAHYASPHFPYHQPSTQQYGGAGSMLHQNSSLELGLPPHQPHYPPNLGSAVASSMNLTNSESEGTSGGGGGNYKMEHDIYYYSNPSSEMNHTDDFLNPMLNDEGLQHMDTFPEDMCPMINGVSASHGPGTGNGIVHGGNTMQTTLTNVGANGASGTTGDRLDASSDSAVSSMGSERVPSLSDGEWNDGSDSAQEYNNPYDYSYSNREGGRGPVAQKKHQMFGKRIFAEGQQPAPTAPEHIPATIKYEYDPYGISSSTGMEGAVGGHLTGKQPAFMQHPEIKYPPYAIDFGRPLRTAHDLVAHNHSYPLPQTQGMTPRPQTRDKKSKKSEEEHLTRDEKRARQLAIPISVQDIINLPMDEFNERLSKYDLSESQLSLIRDIRRRGKNKVAAQNCRKRKLDQINSLAEEVGEMRMRKERLLREREMALKDRSRVKEKYMALYRHVTNNLRDPDGNPCSTSNYSLQLSAEGEVHLLPRPTLESQQQQQQGASGHQSTPAGIRGGTTHVAQGQSSSNTTHPHHPHAQHPPSQQHQSHHHPHHYHQKE